ncbi:hypothetical protein RHMOL_Rhmol13G0110100 [Rhododendron molle]|uniref:Uncharacterized protein n=1 Tax=Rhododendron molle TaxID=49168 RepID=A0ACC0L5Z7_RHOML|nr:hypothetical protein RHMOL_Rhmol13G0110100 [Rhododendron molle]
MHFQAFGSCIRRLGSHLGNQRSRAVYCRNEIRSRMHDPTARKCATQFCAHQYTTSSPNSYYHPFISTLDFLLLIS